MKCATCKGACCEIFELPFSDLQLPGEDVFRWLRLHGHTIVEERPTLSRIQFECKCRALTSEGSCEIYDERPNVCRDMPNGGADCLAYVAARRTPEQYQEIRDEWDPVDLTPR